MSCLTDTLLASLEAGTLDGAEDGAARTHLRDCEPCFARREDLVGTVRLLGAIDAAEIPPPAACWDAVEARITGRATVQSSVAIACSFCKGKLAKTGAVYCAGCIAPHHEDCWEEHGRCAACAAREFVKSTISVRPARRRRRGWLIATAGVLVGAGGAVAALQGRHSEETPVATPKTEARGLETPPVSPQAEERARLDALRETFVRDELHLNGEELKAIVADGVATLLSTSPAADVELIARASLALVGRASHDATAVAGYKRALALRPGSVPAHLARARVAARRNERALARDEYARVVELAPGDFSLVLERAVYLAAHYPEEGRLELDSLIARETDPGHQAMGRMARAGSRKAAGDIEGALADIRTAAALRPDHEHVADALESALREGRDFVAARTFIESFLARHPTNASFWFKHAVVSEQLLDYEGALRDLARATELDPGNAPFLMRARLLVLMSDPGELADEAERKAGRVLALGDLTAEVAALRSKRFREAAEILSSNLIGDAIDEARLHLAMGQRDEAIRRADPSNQQGPAYAAASAVRGVADLGLSEPSSGRSFFEAALGATRDLPVALAGLATTYAKERDAARARSLFRKARAMAVASPDPDEADDFARGVDLARRARLTHRERDRVLARRAFSRVLYRNPLNAVAFLERARLARAFGQWDLAVEDARSATRVDPYFHDAWFLLVRLQSFELPVKSDPTTLRPINLRQGHFRTDSASALTSNADGADEDAEAFALNCLIVRPLMFSSTDVDALRIRALALAREVAPVLSGTSVEPDRAERALVVASGTLALQANRAPADAEVELQAFLEACNVRIGELLGEARTLHEVAHDPWSALIRLELATTMITAMGSKSWGMESLEELRAACRAELAPR